MFAGFAFTKKSLEDVFRLLKKILRTYPGRRLYHTLKKKKVVATSVSDHSKMSLRAKLNHLKYCLKYFLKYSRPVVVTYFAQIVTGTIFILFRRYGGGIIFTSYFGSTEKHKGIILFAMMKYLLLIFST